MPFSIDRAFGILPNAMQLASKRAELLASNIANADTPGYKARDINFKAALQAAQGHHANLPLTITNPRDIQPVQQGSDPSVMYQVPFQPSLDGNTVDLQRNQAEFGNNAVRYQAAVTFLGGRITGLKNALTGK